MTAGSGETTRAQGPLRASDAYRLWADTYDSENALTWLEQDAVRELTPPLAHTTLLDAGCGTGRRLPRTGGAGPGRVIGVDLVFEMIRAGARATPARSAPLAVADLRHLPFADHSFDVIWCRLVVGHVPSLDALYGELARVACEGAHIVITDFHPAAAHSGHTRTFRDGAGHLYEVEHWIHDIDAHREAAQRASLRLAVQTERCAGPEVRSFYEEAGRLSAYRQQEGLPLVLGLLLRA